MLSPLVPTVFDVMSASIFLLGVAFVILAIGVALRLNAALRVALAIRKSIVRAKDVVFRRTRP